MSEWLNDELFNAELELNRLNHGAPGYDYWAGYIDAITNAINELTGMSVE